MVANLARRNDELLVVGVDVVDVVADVIVVERAVDKIPPSRRILRDYKRAMKSLKCNAQADLNLLFLELSH